MSRLLAAILTAGLLMSVPATASATTTRLSKTSARDGTIYYMGKIGPLLDPNGVAVHVRPAPACHRINRVTVSCPFSVRLTSQPRTVTGSLRVHLQPDGLLGYALPWDPSAVWAWPPS